MLKNILGINEKDVISIVGAGGKTTMLFSLAKELKGKVCITTSTKIFMPDESKYDYVYDAYPEKILEKGRYLITGEVNSNNKLTSLSDVDLSKCCVDFDYVLIESDGSKSKPLKGWNEREPVVHDKTTKTVCLLDISVVGKNISDENIFRLDAFKRLISSDGNIINVKHLKEMAVNKDGLIKNSLGEKILFINKVENEIDFDHALELIGLLLDTENRVYDRIVIGSLLNKKYYLMFNGKKISASVLAAGKSIRMGKDKLKLEFKGSTLLEKTIDNITNIYFEEKLLITNNKALNFKGLESKYNINYELGQCESIKLAIRSEMDGYLLLVADQPFLKRETLLRIISKYNETNKIIMCQSSKHVGNPTLIPHRYKNELLSLNGDVGAKSVINKYIKDTHFIIVSDKELIDIDTMKDYERYKAMED